MTMGRYYHKSETARYATKIRGPQHLTEVLSRHKPFSFPDAMEALADHARTILQAENLPTCFNMFQTADGWVEDPRDKKITGACKLDYYIIEVVGRDAGSAAGLAARLLSTIKRVQCPNPSLEDAYTVGRLIERLVATQYYDDQTGSGNTKRSKVKEPKQQHAIEKFHTIADRSTMGPYVIAKEIIKKWSLSPDPPSTDTIIRYLRAENLIS